MTPTQNWPKPYLLSIHEQAVKHGFIWIEPITEADAESLKSRLYRVRRRSDKSMAGFIPPEYHLVMVGQWEPFLQGDDQPPVGEQLIPTGRLPILYDKRADGADLPSIRVPSGAEVAAYTPPPKLVEPAPIIDVNNLDVTMSEGEISNFVDNMRKKAAKKEQENG